MEQENSLQLDDELHVQICAETPGSRLDKWLVDHFPEHSRTYFQFLIESQAVLINGKSAKKRERVNTQDQIDIQFLLPPEISLEPESIPLDILYEDDHILAVNKPAGLVVHPAPGHPRGTFVNALLFHCKALQGTDPVRPGIVHRLDKETSGILLAAKHPQAHAKLVTLFSSRQIDKEYLAICVGTPAEGLIDAPIGRSPKRRQEMCVNFEHGKPAQTRVHLLCQHPEFSLVRIQLLTGRTHQIRVHFKHLNTPILGDPVYGSTTINTRCHTTRQLLHAHRLRFSHPITGEPIDLTAPPPPDFSQYMASLFPRV